MVNENKRTHVTKKSKFIKEAKEILNKYNNEYSSFDADLNAIELVDLLEYAVELLEEEMEVKNEK